MALKFNPFTGKFDFVGSTSSSEDNFSYETIATGITITVPTYQQMALSHDIQVDGLLILNGRVVVGVGE